MKPNEQDPTVAAVPIEIVRYGHTASITFGLGEDTLTVVILRQAPIMFIQGSEHMKASLGTVLRSPLMQGSREAILESLDKQGISYNWLELEPFFEHLNELVKKASESSQMQVPANLLSTLQDLTKPEEFHQGSIKTNPNIPIS